MVSIRNEEQMEEVGVEGILIQTKQKPSRGQSAISPLVNGAGR